ncbi:MAG: RES family NAD+ phosphorylase [Thermoanaerobaculales bacterium]
MSPPDVEISAEQVATAPRITYLGEAFRHMAARWEDPLSGEGARVHGGRFNPPDSFPVLYLCTTRLCAAAELRYRGERLVMGVEGLLPRVLYRYELSLDRVLDLTSGETLDHLGITTHQVVGADLGVPRQIGEAAHATGSQAIRAPSATGVDEVLAVFPEMLGSGRLLAELVERWESIGEL